MRQLDLHGLRVRLDDRLAGAPSEALLGSFPEAGDDEPVALRIALRPSPVRRALPEDGRPSFFHGSVKAVARRGALVLCDGASVLTVSADGASVEGDVHEASLAEGAAFTHATLLLSLLLALRHHGLFHLHAGALVSPGGSPVLVAGDAGAGKTTVTLALAAAGFRYLGDDAVIVARRRSAPRLLALPRAFHVAPRTAEALPGLSRHVGAEYGNSGKRFFDPAGAFPGAALMEAEPPRVLLLPSVADSDATTIEPTSTAEGLGALLEASALVAVEGAADPAEQLALLRDLVDGARIFRLRLGRDLLADPVAWARGVGSSCAL